MKTSVDYLSSVDTVFLFGAGTSRHMRLGDGPPEITVPSDADFFRKARDIRSWCKDEGLVRIGEAALDYVLRSLAQHGIRKEHLMPDADTPGPGVSMETAFCRLEMVRMLRGSAQVSAGKEWAHSVEAFRDLIAIVMAAGQHPVKRNYDGGYDGFVRGMCKARPPTEWAVLTLNYELGIEYAANRYLEEGGYPRTQCMFAKNATEYKQRHLYYYALPGKPKPRLDIGEAINLLKLHGSCNWSICPICKDMRWLWARKGEGKYRVERLVSQGKARHVCRGDKDRHPGRIVSCNAHIVPPTWNKWIADEASVNVWNAAYSLLRKCKQFFIVGTSLPETDVHLRQMIQGAFSSRPPHDRPTVYVVNMQKRKRDRKQYLDRAKQAVGIDIPNDVDHCCWGGFEDKDTIDWIVQRAKR